MKELITKCIDMKMYKIGQLGVHVGEQRVIWKVEETGGLKEKTENEHENTFLKLLSFKDLKHIWKE